MFGLFFDLNKTGLTKFWIPKYASNLLSRAVRSDRDLRWEGQRPAGGGSAKKGKMKAERVGWRETTGRDFRNMFFLTYHPKTQLYGAWIAPSVRYTWP